MMKTTAYRAGTALLFAGALLFSGCMTVTEKAGKLLEGKFDRAVNRYRSSVPKGRGYQVIERAGKSGGGLDILIESMPAVTLKASLPGPEGNFYLRSLEYLGGNSGGWVEFSLTLSGGGNFADRGGGAAGLCLRPPTEPVVIAGGKIRREGVRLSGEEALTALNNRYERIQTLAAWMREQRTPEPAAEDPESFEAYWKPFLLPELVPRKKRPRSYEAEAGGPWVTAEQVRWNTAYTGKILPEELRSLRDSGTLKRDWEECRDWIFLVYAWDQVFTTLETSTVEVRKK
ncbi:MAG: hypothetical protein LBQ46_04880 [Treponema sp.]|nr:hypothetical protein [Treponema sp.]